MSDSRGVVEAGVNQLIDVVDNTGTKAIEALKQLESSMVKVEDSTLNAAISEIEVLQTELVKMLRAAVGVATAPLP